MGSQRGVDPHKNCWASYNAVSHDLKDLNKVLGSKQTNYA